MTNDAYEKLGLESWCLFSVFLKITIKISIIFQKARVHDAYEKSEILESFAKHHDAYKKWVPKSKHNVNILTICQKSKKHSS